MQLYQLSSLCVIAYFALQKKKILRIHWDNRDEREDWDIKVIFNSTFYSESSNWYDEIMKSEIPGGFMWV